MIEKDFAAETIRELQAQLASKTKHCEAVEKELAALKLVLQTYQAGQSAAALEDLKVIHRSFHCIL